MTFRAALFIFTSCVFGFSAHAASVDAQIFQMVSSATALAQPVPAKDSKISFRLIDSSNLKYSVLPPSGYKLEPQTDSEQISLSASQSAALKSISPPLTVDFVY